jgi:hypothetical protein
VTGTLACDHCHTPHARNVFIFGQLWEPGAPCSERECSGTLRILTARQIAASARRTPIRKRCQDCGSRWFTGPGQTCEVCK